MKKVLAVINTIAEKELGTHCHRWLYSGAEGLRCACGAIKKWENTRRKRRPYRRKTETVGENKGGRTVKEKSKAVEDWAEVEALFDKAKKTQPWVSYEVYQDHLKIALAAKKRWQEKYKEDGL